MRALVLTLALALFAAPSWAQRGPALRSPDVLPDGRVTFRLAAPAATDVQVSGDFLAKPMALHKDDKGVWSATVGPVTPDIYNYQLSVNGLAMTRGRLDVPGATARFFDLRPVPHGAVEQRLGVLDERLELTNQRMDISNQRLEVVESTLLTLARRQRTTMRLLRGNVQDTSTIKERVSNLEARVDKLETR